MHHARALNLTLESAATAAASAAHLSRVLHDEPSAEELAGGGAVATTTRLGFRDPLPGY